MILDIPYQSQLPLETEGKVRWCGLVSLWMVLSYYLKEEAPNPQQIIEKYGTEFDINGHQHKDLLKIARDFGLKGFRKSWWAEPGVQPILEKFRAEGESQEEINEWLKTNVDEGLFTIKNFIEKGNPVIVSMDKQFSSTNDTHLVVAIGSEKDSLAIHDPYQNGANYKISEEYFREHWLKQGLFIFP